MNIVYIASPDSVHDAKWINYFARSNRVAVICRADFDRRTNQLNKNVEICPILPRYTIVNLFKNRKVEVELQRIVDNYQPDVIHSMYAVPNAIWADTVATGNHVMTTRGSDLLVDYSHTFRTPATFAQRFTFPVIRKRIEKAFRDAAFVTSTSHAQTEIVSSIRGGLNQTAVIRTGVDTEFFTKQSVTKRRNEFVIFCPRSMKPIYNIDLLVRSFADLLRMKSTKSMLKLRLIDDQPSSEYSEKVRATIANENVSDFVDLLPKVSQEEMRLNYALSDAVIMIPKSDGTPVSAIEAMSMKTAVIVSDLPYDKDIFNESTVWSVDISSSQKIATAILRVMENEAERNRRIEAAFIGALGNASLEVSIKRVTNIYENIRG